MDNALTRGVHHVGLSVCDLEASAKFFVELLGWKEVRRDDAYPAIFVSDGTIMLTLWRVSNPQNYREFDKNHHVGLHHLALTVSSSNVLDNIYGLLVNADIKIEFAPEMLRGGPARHMMCYEPSGNRIEFIWIN